MALNVTQGFPQLPGPMVDPETGLVTSAWRYFFLSLWNRTGQGSGAFDLQASLDGISSTPGAMLIRSLAAWTAITGVTNQVLRFGAAVPTWGLLDGNNFNNESANIVFAGPAGGGAAKPTFRALVEADIPIITDPNIIPIKPATVGLAISAAGTVQGDATALSEQWNQITTVAAGTGVRLDNASTGIELIVFNRGANTLNIYPKSGSQINALGVNNPITLATNGRMTFQPVSATQLYGA